MTVRQTTSRPNTTNYKDLYVNRETNIRKQFTSDNFKAMTWNKLLSQLLSSTLSDALSQTRDPRHFTHVCLASVVAVPSSFFTSFFASGFGPSLQHWNTFSVISTNTFSVISTRGDSLMTLQSIRKNTGNKQNVKEPTYNSDTQEHSICNCYTKMQKTQNINQQQQNNQPTQKHGQDLVSTLHIFSKFSSSLPPHPPPQLPLGKYCTKKIKNNMTAS